MLLDVKGGPNHVGNFCDACIIADEVKQELKIQIMYYYLGHFSRFIAPGSVRLHMDIKGPAKPQDVEVAAFLTPNDEVVMVVLNLTKYAFAFKVMDMADKDKELSFTIPENAIQTLLFKKF